MNKSLIVKKDSFFSKIKNFIGSLFYKKTKKDLKEQIEFDIVQNDFNDSIVIKKDNRKEELITLQEDLENNTFLFEDISDEDFIDIINLYDTQIKELNKDTERLNKSTEIYKGKIQLILKKSN